MAYVRLLVGAELLASDFYSQAVAASTAKGAVARYLKRAYLNEQEHYQSVAGILSGALVDAGRIGGFRLQLSERHVRRPRRRSSRRRRRSRESSWAHTSAHSAGSRRTRSRPASRRSPRARRSTPRTSRRHPAARRSGCRSRRLSPSSRRPTRWPPTRPRGITMLRNHARTAALAASIAAFLAFAGGATASSSRATAGITVYAAASLTDVFPAIDGSPSYSFAGSNALATQITNGAPADVFASANTTIPAQLYAAGHRREARGVHAQHARDRRPEVEPGRISTASTTSRSRA